jgi:hypothetical protein
VALVIMWLRDSWYFWQLPPPRRLGANRGSLSGFGDCCRLRSIDCNKGLLFSFSMGDSQKATLVKSWLVGVPLLCGSCGTRVVGLACDAN